MIQNLSDNATAVYYYLKARTKRNGECCPSVKKISKDLNISKSTAFRAIKELETDGLLTRENRHQKHGGQCSNLYRMGDDKHV